MSIEFAVLGDLHLRVGNKPINRMGDFDKQIEDKIKWVVDEMKARGIKTLILTGDLQDLKSIKSSKQIMDILSTFRQLKWQGIDVYSIRGNHDSSEGSFPLWEMLVELNFVVPLTTLELGQYKFYGLDFEEDVNLLKFKIQDLNESIDPTFKNVLVVHEHLIPKLDNFFKVSKSNYILYDELSVIASNFYAVIGGHYHKPFPLTKVQDTQIINPSSLVRTKVNERFIPNVYFSDKEEMIDIASALKAEEIFVDVASKNVSPNISMNIDTLVNHFKDSGNGDKNKVLDKLTHNLSPKARDLLQLIEQELKL